MKLSVLYVYQAVVVTLRVAELHVRLLLTFHSRVGEIGTVHDVRLREAAQEMWLSERNATRDKAWSNGCSFPLGLACALCRLRPFRVERLGVVAVA